MPLIPKSSYYDKHYRQTAALIRARQPYLVKNIFTGIGLFSFVIAVCEFGITILSFSVILSVQADMSTHRLVHNPCGLSR